MLYTVVVVAVAVEGSHGGTMSAARMAGAVPPGQVGQGDQPRWVVAVYSTIMARRVCILGDDGDQFGPESVEAGSRILAVQSSPVHILQCPKRSRFQRSRASDRRLSIASASPLQTLLAIPASRLAHLPPSV